ncbi:MAG: mechanosensitive ion channel family protein [Haloferacaceae archaeon]
MPGPVDEVRAILESFVTPEARVAATAALLAATAVFAVLVAPWLVRQGSRFVHRVVFEREEIPVAAEDVSWLVPVRAVVRSVQVAAVLLAGFALLLVWGQVALALELAAVVGALLPTLGRVLVTVLLVVSVFVGTDLLQSWLDAYAEQSAHINEHQEGIVFRVLQLVLLIAVGLAALAVWDYNLDGLLVGAGFLGIVVGMAARQTLGSLIAGFVLMFSRPFEIGDWVVVDDYEGVVTDITIVNTRLRNFDGETVVIPNDQASNSTLVNRTDRDRLRLRLEVGIDYDADLDRAESVAEETIRDIDEVRRVPAPQVVPKRFGDSAIGLELRFWIDNPSARRKWRAHATAVREIKAAFDREGIKIPYPQRELSGRAETGGFRVVDGDASGDAAGPDGEAADAVDHPSPGSDGAGADGG